MKRNLLLLCLIHFMAIALHSQETVSAAGGEAIGSGGSSSYTLGQVFYQTRSGVNGSVAEGVQQPFEISVVTEIESDFAIDLKVEAYPNPTTDFLTLAIADADLSDISFQLYDIQGRIIQTQEINDNETRIDVKSLQPATYFVKILQSDAEVKVFKIVKK